MKSAAYSDTGLLRHSETDERPGEAWGVILAGDYTAEHEQGIGALLTVLGIDAEGIMIEGRSMANGGRDLKIITGQTTETHFVPGPTEKNPNRQVRKKAVAKPKSLTTYHHHTKLLHKARK